MKDKVLSGTRGFLAEFKSFAIKGNAFELAIAVVIGNAFTGVVNSLVKDLITPFLGLLTNNVDFKTLEWEPYAGLVVTYGNFLQAFINFIIVALSIFVVFKLLVTARKRVFERHEEDKIPDHEKAEDVRLLEEIRDILKGNAKEPGA
ncbi:MAG: large conductance mechanosensitive channel protein MscL [Candidatus Pacebacteria bacterium]|nr:large conductance mechanosensitive channel protein MscL [Candidatus Paceibacterota bacterium]